MKMILMDQPCPIEGMPSAISDVHRSFHDFTVDSPHAGGKYIADKLAKNELSNMNNQERVKLNSRLVEQRSFEHLFPKINSASIFEAQQKKELHIVEHVEGILRYLESKSCGLGTGVQIQSFLQFESEYNFI